MIHHLNIDLETFSSVDIKKAGMYKYVQSPDFEILLFGYSLDGAPVEVIDLTHGIGIPDVIRRLLFDPACTKHAFNAAFEWYCLSKYYNTPDPCAWAPQWRDTQLHGLYCGYTAGLGATGAALGLPEDKRKLATGKALIKLFCTPTTPTARNGGRTRTLPHHEPEKWELFKEYNRQDVVTEQEIQRRLSPFPVPDFVQRQWETDLRINARGVAVDLDLIHGALECSDAITDVLTQEAVQLTGLDNPNSVPQLSGWLTKETGSTVTDLRKETVKTMLEGEIPSDTARRALEIRQELSKTSVKKYTAMTEAMCEDGRVRGMLQFYGANRSGRWAGRLVQVQNLPRTYLHGDMLDLARELVKGRKLDHLQLIYGSVPDTLSQLIRTALVPAPGHQFVDADFSAIEARVIAWLAGEDWVLDVFRSHGKIYEATAANMFGVPIEKIVKGNPEYDLRQKGKVATLALGYNGAAPALINMGALKMGIPEEDLPDIVRRWREANKRIVALRYAVENAAIGVVQTGRPAGVRGLLFALEGDHATDQYFLTITLPCGRKLYYARPSLGTNQWGKPSLQYWGMNQTTKKWMPIETYGGKLTENIVQAIARDCLAENIERLEAAGFPVVFHVHDEVIIDIEKEKADLDTVYSIMSQPIDWAPGLPLSADGWCGGYYTKD